MKDRFNISSEDFLISLLCIFLAAGCTPNLGLPTSILVPTPVVSDLKLITATIDPENTATTQSDQKSLPTPLNWPDTTTIVATSTPAQIMYPSPTNKFESTMTAAEVKTFVITTLSENGGCSLPCFWGLSPQVTDAYYVQSLMQRIGNSVSEKSISAQSNAMDLEEGYAEFNLYNNGLRTHISISYHNQQETFKQVIVNAESYTEEGNNENANSRITFGNPIFMQQLDYYMLPNILENYDEPSDILILPILYDAPNVVQDILSIVLLYREKGFMVEYIFPINYEDTMLVGCPNRVGYVNIVTWIPDKDFDISSELSKKSGMGINTLNVASYRSIEAATSLTIDEFYKIFSSKQNEECIKTPYNLWTN